MSDAPAATNYRDKCPKCGAPQMGGYGLAFGGGCGSYNYCENEECDWFEKFPDRSEDE